ncbi:MAG TPA: hypothetical protein VGN07_10560 [Steroidobacteraceae bacterium]|jgi:hypothetical protein
MGTISVLRVSTEDVDIECVVASLLSGLAPRKLTHRDRDRLRALVLSYVRSSAHERIAARNRLKSSQ